jgi:hypothetical protein
MPDPNLEAIVPTGRKAGRNGKGRVSSPYLYIVS